MGEVEFLSFVVGGVGVEMGRNFFVIVGVDEVD